MTERRTAVTRDAILEALAELVAEDGVRDLAVQSVADRAGVSHRTVYRHFPTKEALLEGLSDWVGQRMAADGGVMAADALADVPDAVARNFQLFDRYGDVVEALVRLQVGGGVASRTRERRTREFERLVTDVRGRDDARSHAIAAMVRHVASSRTWFGLRHEAELDGATAAAVGSWAARVLVDAIAGGDIPPVQEHVT